MTDVDHARQAFINSVVRILNAWNAALNDANARGYPTRLLDPTRGDADNTSVEAAALTRSQAKEWLHDLDKVTTTIVGLANRSQLLWAPTPRHGSTKAGVTVGQRTNTVEVCGLCQEPVTGGHADPIRRIDGQAFHGRSCWFTVTRSRT
jgi:hypothetical protein